jgi:hypothetical protein
MASSCTPVVDKPVDTSLQTLYLLAPCQVRKKLHSTVQEVAHFLGQKLRKTTVHATELQLITDLISK